MKKLQKGFTLAETLITLAIIGVVAVLTIPQLAIKIQAHRNAAIVSKTVYQVELGCQNLLQNTNKNSSSFSNIDKILLVDNWQSYILKYLGASPKSTKQTAWTLMFNSPAYASNPTLDHAYEGSPYDCELPGGRAPDFTPGDTAQPGPNIEAGNNLDKNEFERYTGSPKNNDDDDNIDDGGGTVTGNDKIIPGDPISENTIYKMKKYGAEFKVSGINSTKSSAPDAIVFKMTIDTNGFERNPGRLGTDQFTFNLTNTGKMVPVGTETIEFVKNGYKAK